MAGNAVTYAVPYAVSSMVPYPYLYLQDLSTPRHATLRARGRAWRGVA